MGKGNKGEGKPEKVKKEKEVKEKKESKSKGKAAAEGKGDGGKAAKGGAPAARKQSTKKPKKFVLKGKEITMFTDLPPNLNRGYLYKEGGRHKNWKKRFCVIHDNHLFYFKSEKGRLKGMINLTDRSTQVEPIKRKPNCFRLYHPTERVYYFYAQSQDELNHWMRYIGEEIRERRDPGSVKPASTVLPAAKKDDKKKDSDEEEDVFAAISRAEAERKDNDSPPPMSAEDTAKANEERRKRELAVSKLREQMQTKEKELLLNPNANPDDVTYPEGLLSPRSVNELRDEVRREVREQEGLLATTPPKAADSSSSDEESPPQSKPPAEEDAAKKMEENHNHSAMGMDNHSKSEHSSKEPSEHNNRDGRDGSSDNNSDDDGAKELSED